MTIADGLNFYTCSCPKCGTPNRYSIYEYGEDTDTIICKNCLFCFEVDVNGIYKKPKCILPPDIVYSVYGGKGNPKLLSWSTDRQYDYNIGNYHGNEYDKKQYEIPNLHPSSSSPQTSVKVLCKPRTVIRLGKWIGYRLRRYVV